MNGCTLAACRGLNEDGTCPCGLVTLCEAVVPVQVTVEAAIADASLPLQEGRYRDQRADSDTK